MQNVHADTIETATPDPTIGLSIAGATRAFAQELRAKNRADSTIVTYLRDLAEFAAWLAATNVTATRVDLIQRVDITKYLAELGRRGVKGVTRAKKFSAIRELFRFLVTQGILTSS